MKYQHPNVRRKSEYLHVFWSVTSDLTAQGHRSSNHTPGHITLSTVPQAQGEKSALFKKGINLQYRFLQIHKQMSEWDWHWTAWKMRLSNETCMCYSLQKIDQRRPLHSSCSWLVGCTLLDVHRWRETHVQRVNWFREMMLTWFVSIEMFCAFSAIELPSLFSIYT